MNESFYLAIEKLMLRATSDFVGFADKDGEPFWSTGVLVKAKTRILTRTIITPSLHNSITPADFRTKDRQLKPVLRMNVSHLASEFCS